MHDLKPICLSPLNTILDAVECLNKSRHGIVLVIDENMFLLGSITDADIRRGIARKIPLDNPLSVVMHKNPITVPINISRAALTQKFAETRLRALPALGKDNKILDCFFVESFILPNPAENVLMIMAGGLGTRMGELTATKPKPLLEVKGKPMIQHIIEMAVFDQFENIVISTCHMSHMIEDFCGDGSKFGAQISYINEQKPLGTGGSFGLLKNVIGPIVVSNSDIMTTVGFRQLVDFHLSHNASATMAVLEHQIENPFGVVKNDGVLLTGFEEKPVWRTNINAGIYVLNANLRQFISSNEAITMPNVIDRARKAGERTVIYPLYEQWIDLGTEVEFQRYK